MKRHSQLSVRLPRVNSSPGSRVQWDGVGESFNKLEITVEFKVNCIVIPVYDVYGSAHTGYRAVEYSFGCSCTTQFLKVPTPPTEQYNNSLHDVAPHSARECPHRLQSSAIELSMSLLYTVSDSAHRGHRAV